jgi:N-acetylglucosaminyl-diphospho-decaprenol L-rhamnosyltransferase
MQLVLSPLPAQARVLVVTVNYRTAELAVRALASLATERSSLGGLEAVVVDNASGDGSADRIRAAIEERGFGSWARVLENPRNSGFGAGNNLVLREALSRPDPPDHVLLLNPDAALDPGALVSLVEFLNTHPQTGFAGPRTEVGRGNLRGTAFRFPGILNSLDEGLHFGPATRLLARWQLAPPARPEPHRTDWLSGGCLLIRRAVLEQVGLFDEAFFLYFEEVDLALRAARAGWESWYVPAASILHDAGASTGASAGRELARRMPRYWFESRRRYFLKNRGRVVCLVADLAWAGGNLLWNLRRALSRAPRKEPLGFWSDFVRFNLLGRELSDSR